MHGSELVHLIIGHVSCVEIRNNEQQQGGRDSKVVQVNAYVFGAAWTSFLDKQCPPCTMACAMVPPHRHVLVKAG